MPITLQAAGAKDIGLVREINEDEFFLRVMQSSDEEPVGLFIVADGMGGHMGGEFASEWAVKAIREHLQHLFAPVDRQKTVKLDLAEIEAMAGAPAPTRLLPESEIEREIRAAVQRANEVVLGIAKNRPEKAADTGTTLTMAVVKGATAYIANVGDSRTYLYREASVKPITEDHSLVARLVAMGQITAEEAYEHPQRNLIYRFLGDKPQVEVDLYQQELRPGDQLLLCSDGLWEMVRDPQLAKILEKAPSPAVACERLIKAANANGGEDNIAVVVVWISATGVEA